MKTLFKSISFILCGALLVLACCCSTTQAQSSEKEIRRNVCIEGHFSGLLASSAIEVTYTSNSSQPVAVISGPEFMVENLDYKIDSKGVLSFYFKKMFSTRNGGSVRIALNGPMLSSYEVTSAAEIKVTTPIVCQKVLNIQASSAGDITLNGVKAGGVVNISASSSSDIYLYSDFMASEAVNVASSSSSNVKFKGNATVNVLNLNTSAAGDISMSSLKASVLNITSSSASDIDIDNIEVGTVNATISSTADITLKKCTARSLNVNASSTSSFTVAGTATDCNLEASSGADIDVSGLSVKQKPVCRTSSSGSIKR